MSEINYPSRYENEIDACITDVKLAMTGNIHIDVNNAYGISEYSILAKAISEENDHVSVYIWHKNWSLTYNGKKS